MTHVAESHHGGHSESLTRSAVRATAHCLTGCAIGEVLGMMIAISVALAFAFGYALTLGPILAVGVPYRRAVVLTVASDTLFIATMELIDNLFLLVVPGAMAAGLSDGREPHAPTGGGRARSRRQSQPRRQYRSARPSRVKAPSTT